ncbi:histidine phosphatase family protein [Nocardioides sp. CPCC 205120]|uniref:histidine phosphatase family protein n=1 Tax=Nocardioides sp. CPCC 205120 TaxID=3406462 RepID=UPI003B5002BD
MRLILVRHGQTSSNVAGALDTAAPGASLTDLGRRQADALVDAFADETFARAHASNRVRTQETAAPLVAAHGLTLEVVDGLGEISAGEHEMGTSAEAVRAYVGCVAGWLTGDLDATIRGGETGHEFLARYDAALRAVAERSTEGAASLVVSHGAAIRAYVGIRAAQADSDQLAGSRLGNTGGAVLEGDPDAGWRLLRWSGDPFGGAHLADEAAHDVTGESAEEAVEDAEETSGH